MIGLVSQEAKVDRRSVARWRRDRKFLKACALIVRAANRVDEELADRANLRMAMQGSAAHYELLLRRRGLYDRLPPDEPIGPSAPTGPGGLAIGQVNFFGLPAPPSAEQRAAVNPPPGSGKILETQAVRK